MVLASLAAHHQAGIESRSRCHTKDFACRRFDSDDTTNLTFQQPFCQHLKLDVNTQGQVLACNGSLVQSPIHIPALNSSTGITQQYFHPFFTTQLLLIKTLNALFPDKVTTHIVIIRLYILLGYFSDVTQHMCCRVIIVLSDCSTLYVETWKLEQFFLEHPTFLCRKLGHENLMCIRRISRIRVSVFQFTDTSLKIVRCYAQSTTKIQRIQIHHLLHDHSHIIGRLIVH